MLTLASDQASEVLRRWLDASEPSFFTAWHVATTGNGACLVDRWPEPRAALALTYSNYALVGSPGALDADELRGRVVGFLEGAEAFDSLVRRAFAGAVAWPRITLVERTLPAAGTVAAEVRPLAVTDAPHVWALTPESLWIANTWGGPAGLAAGGYAWGAFVDGHLASVACSFSVADRFEDLGVITEPAFRGRGLSPACAAALCADIHARGRQASWTTSLDNTASLRVAEKLGFRMHHHDRLWVIGRSVPEPAVYP